MIMVYKYIFICVIFVFSLIHYSTICFACDEEDFGSLNFSKLIDQAKINMNSDDSNFTKLNDLSSCYIPTGTHQFALLEACADHGWEIKKLTGTLGERRASEFQETLACRKHFRFSRFDIWGYTIQISFDFNDNMLSRSRARASYMSPFLK